VSDTLDANGAVHSLISLLDRSQLVLTMGVLDVNKVVVTCVPVAVTVAFALAAWTGLLDVCQQFGKLFASTPTAPTTSAAPTTPAAPSALSATSSGGEVARRFLSCVLLLKVVVFSIAGTGMVMVSAMPLCQQLQAHWPNLPGRMEAAAVHGALEQYNVASGYGLFRRMTGVGAEGQGGRGQAGAAPTVARPEVIVEASHDGEVWTEIEFKHKPGAVTSSPTWVAPHQPRLDWQMWFAALRGKGGGTQIPWFLHLMHKIQVGSPAVVDLLAPIPAAVANPKYIRAKLYAYDFTRLNTSWAQASGHVLAMHLVDVSNILLLRGMMGGAHVLSPQYSTLLPIMIRHVGWLDKKMYAYIQLLLLTSLCAYLLTWRCS
jgi:hypothetical protein